MYETIESVIGPIKIGLLAVIICFAFVSWLGFSSDFLQISLMLASVSTLGFLSIWNRKDFHVNWVDYIESITKDKEFVNRYLKDAFVSPSCKTSLLIYYYYDL